MSPPQTQALSAGALGLALLHIERDDDAAVGALLREAVAGGVSVGANASLFHGAPALEFVLTCAGRTDPRLRDAVDRVVVTRLATALQRRKDRRCPPLREFDLTCGLTGLGALLLARGEASTLLRDLLTYLISLSDPVDAAGEALPGWWSLDYPGHEEIAGGHANNGLAHGIAGPLALLALAARHGVQVHGQVDAIDAFARWLERYGHVYWITREQVRCDQPPPVLPGRPSWCYGELGVARALQLAGIAVGDTARRQAAEDRAVAVLTDPDRLARITDASLCHGWAGALTLTRAIAADSATPGHFTEPVHRLTAHLATGVTALPTPGFLEGRVGAQLALAGTNATSWTRALLIN